MKNKKILKTFQNNFPKFQLKTFDFKIYSFKLIKLLILNRAMKFIQAYDNFYI